MSSNFREAKKMWEREFIARILEANNYRPHATAKALGMNPTTLWRKMKKLGMETGKETLDGQKNSLS